ncbi:MAG: hypothetical protein JWN48_711 [Myxococcaceae bacterium]|nr:hypothetical protein [Myxococcaceae bacterium]
MARVLRIVFASCLAALSGFGCAWPTLHVQNVQTATGGVLVLTGSGFTPKSAVWLGARVPGSGAGWFDTGLAAEARGKLDAVRYAYSFALPHQGNGCPPAASTTYAGRTVVVRALDVATQRETMTSIALPDCNWSGFPAPMRSVTRRPIRARD